MSIDLSSFTTGQVTFIQQLAANTGLDAGVVAAWVIQEESGSAAQSRQAAGNHDWLNVGYTDTATLGAGNNVWANPTAAANATANWLNGTWNDPGFGTASAGIQAILKTAGQSPQSQIVAIQSSGWASSRYPNFTTIYGELSPQLKKALGAGVAKGGVAGAGGSGTTPDGAASTTYAFEISGAGNPDEDYWTGINRLAQEVNWYLFSSGEYLYYMDGQEMLAQAPAATIDRLADAGRIHQNQGSLSYDNPLALDTPIPTPDGWTTMGELEPGDMVIRPNGQPSPVVRCSPVFLGRDCYRVRFNDGTAIIADGSHLWETRSFLTAGDRARGGVIGIRSTAEIAEAVVSTATSHAYAHRVKVTKPLDLPDRELLVDPYVFGYWLGDGNRRHPSVTIGADDIEGFLAEVERAGYSHFARLRDATGFSRAQHWLVTISILPEYRKSKKGEDSFTRRLATLGVLGNKHIPTSYLRASAIQRQALLQGLMDADGSIGRYCCLQLSDRVLAEGALELIRSLGFRVGWCEKPPRGFNKVPQYVMNFATRDHLNPFRIARKAQRYAERQASKANRGSADARSIIAVEPVPSVPTRCILLDTEDHLFLAGEAMIPTRNTAFSYVSDHKRRFRTQRRTKVALAQSPTEGTFELICGIDEILGGDVVQLVNFGPGDGRWIVAECRRSVFDVYSELTLVPALAPISELAAAGTTGSGTGSTTSTVSLTGVYPVKLTGTLRNHVVQVALAAVARQKSSGAYTYRQNGVLPSSLFGPAPVLADCAAFSRVCYKDAGAPDPMGDSPAFSSYANSTALFAKGTPVSTPQPGDLCFFGPGGSTHVNVYIGNGSVANMGAPGQPVVESLQGVAGAISGGLAGVRSYL